MRLDDVKGEPVVSLAGADRLGTVDDVFLDTDRHQILGFRIRRGGVIPHYEAVLLDDVKSIGRDAVTVPEPGRVNVEDKFGTLRNSLRGDEVIGSRVMTENGHEIGTITDLEVNFETGAITDYVLGGTILDRLRHEQHTVPVNGVKSIGDRLVVVDNAVTTE